MRRVAALAILVLSSLLFLPGCNGTGEIYHAQVDRVEPVLPGLSVEATGGFGGAVIITNMTSRDVYIYDPSGHEEWKITSTGTFCRNVREGICPIVTPDPAPVVVRPTDPFCESDPSNCRYSGKGNWLSYSFYPVSYCGTSCGMPRGRYQGQVMREWVIEGRVGDTPFSIYGRTVYEPRLP